ncbi:MAG: hypothetical protein Q4D02_03155 [Clostridia bacterium]|nr:hypothetical protein [Clostridia bacterium]
MPASRRYSDFYEGGSTARKLAPKRKKEPVKKVTSKRTTHQQSQKRQAIKKKNNASMVAFILTGFAMSMIIIYRFNVINEKNLQSQALKKELEQVDASLVSAQMEVEQNTDLNKIEAYAKQQLGMQKPGKNQTIYVDTSEEASKVVSKEQNTTILESVTNFIRNAIKNIF